MEKKACENENIEKNFLPYRNIQNLCSRGMKVLIVVNFTQKPMVESYKTSNTKQTTVTEIDLLEEIF